MLELLLGLIMSIGHYFSESFSDKFKKYRPQLISLSAGVSITYIFLDLFPMFSQQVVQLNQVIFLSVLLGFSVHHLAEKYIYLHVSKKKRRKDIALEHSIISFVYHFFVGIILASITLNNVSQGLLFFIPVFLYTTLSTLPVTAPRNRKIKIALSASTFLGVIFSFFIRLDPVATSSLIGIIIGALLFSVTRHSLPMGKRGKPTYFILGTLGYSLLIVLIWFFFSLSL